MSEAITFFFYCITHEPVGKAATKTYLVANTSGTSTGLPNLIE